MAELNLSNLSANDYLELMSATSAFDSAMENRANTWRQLTGRPGTFSLGSSGTSSMLKSYMSQREDEILAAILEKQREAISTGKIKGEGGGIAGWSKWWKKQSYPPEYAARARAAFQSIQGETFQEAARGEAELAAGYAKDTASRADLQEKERIAVDAGISEIFTKHSPQYRKAAQYAPSWQTLEASIRDEIYGSEASESVKNAVFDGVIKQLRDAYKPVQRFEIEKRREAKATAKREAAMFPLNLIIAKEKVLTIENKAAVEEILENAGAKATALTEGIEDQTSYLSAREELELWLDTNADVSLLGGPERDRILSAFEKRNDQYSKPDQTYSQEMSDAQSTYDSLFKGILGGYLPNTPNFTEWLLGDKTFTFNRQEVDGWLRRQRLIGTASNFAVEPMMGYARDTWMRGPLPNGWLPKTGATEDAVAAQALEWYNRMVTMAEDLSGKGEMSARMKDKILKELERLYKERVGKALPGTPFGGS